MSEYWKSTPKYWCKHCSTFVRDTKLEKTNHEATPKHQGNLKRFLRDLHRGHENAEKDKERARSEVARLNGLVAGGGSGPAASSSSSGAPSVSRSSGPKPQATASQRKQQLAQLAEMGVAIPDEFRPDMAMAGEWEVTSQRVIGEGDGEKKPDALALGVRKRQVDEEEEEALEAKKAKWGSTYRYHTEGEEDGDLDALLSNATRKGKEPALKPEDVVVKQEIKAEGQVDGKSDLEQSGETKAFPELKKSESDGESDALSAIPQMELKQEVEDQVAPGVVFKKRKAKNIRQR